MRFLIVYFILCFNPLLILAQSTPKLVVGIVVDQMRADYLSRYQNRYGQDGFNRMIREGFNCEQTYIHYLPSFTAPGHATIYTGSAPALHGIVANYWTDRNTGRGWYCTEDTTVESVGGKGKSGKMSPKNLLATTVTDELRLASNFRSKVFGISIKDRGSILPAGHAANGAFWYDSHAGQFISSTFYYQELPKWMKDFNAARPVDRLMQKAWTPLYDIETYNQSTADDNPYEGLVDKKGNNTFPHPYPKDKKDKYSLLRKVPAGNTLIFEAAKACIEYEDLGQNQFADFLCLSFSATDYAGHLFGPNAPEVEDMYLRLDKELGEFLNYLDKKIGKGNYTVFLTADHGGAHNSMFLNDHKIPGGNASEDDLKKDLNLVLQDEFAVENLVSKVSNYQIFFDKEKIKELDPEDVFQFCIDFLLMREEVSHAVNLHDYVEAGMPQHLKKMVNNGYFAQRSGDLQLILKPGWYHGYAKTGTTHGSWNPYDTHIPLLFMGAGVQHGRLLRRTEMCDIAPTLSAILNIQTPNACIGAVIPEVVK